MKEKCRLVHVVSAKVARACADDGIYSGISVKQNIDYRSSSEKLASS